MASAASTLWGGHSKCRGLLGPELCSPADPPITELPLRTTRCVEESTTVASRNARVAYPELVSRAPFPMLLPASLPDGLIPHWTTLRVTDRRAGTGAPRQYGTIVRYLGEADEPWLLLLQDTGEAPAPWLDQIRAQVPEVRLRDTQASLLDGLPDYDGPGTACCGRRAVCGSSSSVPTVPKSWHGLPRA